MSGGPQDGMHCAEFENLLAEAMDGALDAPRMQDFHAHAALCPTCGPMFVQAQAGLRWMKSLPEVEPPRNLVRNILIATSGAEKAEAAVPSPTSPWLDKLRGWMQPALLPVFATVRQPRFALSFGMAFFSVSMLLNATGVKVSDLKYLDLRPRAIQNSAVRGYYEARAGVVKYYENIRFVYEIESRVREMKNAAQPAEDKDQPAKPKEQKRQDDNTSGQPDPRQQNYSREDAGNVLLASLRGRSPQKPDLMSSRRIA